VKPQETAISLCRLSFLKAVVLHCISSRGWIRCLWFLRAKRGFLTNRRVEAMAEGDMVFVLRGVVYAFMVEGKKLMRFLHLCTAGVGSGFGGEFWNQYIGGGSEKG
jgi:hypothetical protein